MMDDVSIPFSSDSFGFPIAMLAPGQTMEAVGHVSVGVGRTHAKHAAVGQVAIKQVDPSLSLEALQDHLLEFRLSGQVHTWQCVNSCTRSLVHAYTSLRQAFAKKIVD
jgi:hypothetical protein